MTIAAVRGCLLAWVLAATVVHAAPTEAASFNDDFTKQQLLGLDTGGGGVELQEAGREAGEPLHGGTRGLASHWWRWTADRTGPVVVRACGSQSEPLLGVYVGADVAALSAVTTASTHAFCYSSWFAGTEWVPVAKRFTAVAGTTYRIAAATDDEPASGSIGVMMLEVPPGDDLADAEALPFPPRGSETAALAYATREAGEPDHAGRPGGRSTWYAYTPPRSQTIRVEACGGYSKPDTTVAVYRGATRETLAPVASSDDGCGAGARLTASLEGGEPYRIAVTQHGEAPDPIYVVADVSGPDDAFSEAPVLGAAPRVDLDLATREPGEPQHGDIAGAWSAWRTWTATESRPVILTSCRGGVDDARDPVLAVYRGASVESLTPVADAHGGCRYAGTQVRFDAVAGATYRIAVATDDPRRVEVDLAVVQAPRNDTRAEAAVLAGTKIAASNALATAEPGERAHATTGGGRSLWYRWSPPRSGTASFRVCNADFDVVAAAYPVDPAAPPIAESRDETDCGSAGTGADVRFAVEAGETVFLAIDGEGGETGDIGTIAAFVRGPVNDDFEHAEPLRPPLSTSLTATAFLYPRDATAEAGEPAHGGRPAQRSVWWRWTAPVSGRVAVSTCGSSSDGDVRSTTLGVYEGDAVDALATRGTASDGCNDGDASLTFTARRGGVYAIAVDHEGPPGLVRLQVAYPPSNDMFADAEPITTGATTSLDSTTSEPDEPSHAGFPPTRSAWYAWTAPQDGPALVSLCAEYFDGLLGVYTGADVNALVPVAANDDGPAAQRDLNGCERGGFSVATFDARKGTTYRIAVDGKAGAFGTARVRVRFADPSDRFDGARVIEEPPSATEIPIQLGTAEPGEPAHGGRPATRSAWARFTPSKPLLVTAGVCASVGEARTVIGVYTGTDVSALSAVPVERSAGGCAGDTRGQSVTFRAAAGTTYSVALDADAPTTARMVTSVRPANDALADAEPVPPLRAMVEGTLRDATTEPLEPDHDPGPGTTGRSAWYRIDVDQERLVRLSVCGTGSVHLAAYEGSTPEHLVPARDVVATECGAGAGDRLVIRAVPGSTVFVAVASPSAWSGPDYVLRVEEPPPNDDFADARAIDAAGDHVRIAEIAHATREPGEPRHAGGEGRRSAWWTYRTPVARTVELRACGPSPDPLLAVYTGGSLATLEEVTAGVDDHQYHCDESSFHAAAGVRYWIAVDAEESDPDGNIRLELAPVGPPNDAFASADLIGIGTEAHIDLHDATREEGEPLHPGGPGASAWYRLTPERDLEADITTCGDDTALAVYRGDEIGSLVLVGASVDDEPRSPCPAVRDEGAFVTTTLEAGVPYRIAIVDEYRGARAHLVIRERAAGDAFADALPLTPGVARTARTLSATTEHGEPAHGSISAARSVWYRWTPSTTGRAVIDACGGDDPFTGLRIAGYEGTALGTLRPIGSSQGSPGCIGGGPRLEFIAIAGVAYRFAVDDASGSARAAREVTLRVAPANDARATAAPLPAPAETTSVDLSAASREPGEPRHAGAAGAGSAWYRLDPSVTAGVEITTCDTDGFDTVLAAYEVVGSGSLVPVARGDDELGCSAGMGARASFTAQAGKRYVIAVDSAAQRRGVAHLHVASVPVRGPRTSIVSDVPRRTRDDAVRVEFSSEAAAATFECRLDDASVWTPCASPVTRSGHAEGEHRVSVRAVLDGVPAGAAESVAYTVDRAGPRPSLRVPGEGAVVSPGEVDYEGLCATGPGDAPRYRVVVWRGEQPTGTPIIDDRDEWCGSGIAWWVFLGEEGPYTMRVHQLDDLGNEGHSPSRTFFVSRAAPTVTLTSPVEDATRAEPLVVTGLVAGPSPVTVRVREMTAGGWSDVRAVPVDPQAGAFRVELGGLVDGRYEISADQTDEHGVRGSSGAREVTIDRTAPAVEITSPDTFALTNDGTIRGRGEARTLRFRVADNGGRTVHDRTFSPAANGSWSAELPASLPDGEYHVTAFQQDALGNGRLAGRRFTLDRTAPKPAVVAPVDGGAVFSTALDVVGTAGLADAAPVRVELRDGTGRLRAALDASVISGRWAVRFPRQAAGVYRLDVVQRDAAGNEGRAGARTVAVVDPVAQPVPPPLPPPPVPRPSPPSGSAPKEPTTTMQREPSARSRADRLVPGSRVSEHDAALGDGNRLFVRRRELVRIVEPGAVTVAAMVCPEGCTIRTRGYVRPGGSRRSKRSSLRRVTVKEGESRRLTMRVTRSMWRALRRADGGKVKLRVSVTAADGEGHKASVPLEIRVP